jgi:hypothetical protein
MPIVNTLFAIVFLSGRPQDLPTSRTLLGVLAALSVAVGYAIDGLHANDQTVRLLFATAQTVLLGVWIWLALFVRGYPERWLQTMSALYAANVILNLLAWPISAFLQRATAVPQALPLVFLILTGFWFLAIMTQVLREALVMPTPVSALVSFGLLILNGWVLLGLFPLQET